MKKAIIYARVSSLGDRQDTQRLRRRPHQPPQTKITPKQK